MRFSSFVTLFAVATLLCCALSPISASTASPLTKLQSNINNVKLETTGGAGTASSSILWRATLKTSTFHAGTKNYLELSPRTSSAPANSTWVVSSSVPLFDFDLMGSKTTFSSSCSSSPNLSLRLTFLNTTHIEFTTLNPVPQNSDCSTLLHTISDVPSYNQIVTLLSQNKTHHLDFNYTRQINLSTFSPISIKDAYTTTTPDGQPAMSWSALLNIKDGPSHSPQFEFGAFVDNQYFPISPQSPKAVYFLNGDSLGGFDRDQSIIAMGDKWSILSMPLSSSPRPTFSNFTIPFNPADYAPAAGSVSYGVYMAWILPQNKRQLSFVTLGEIDPKDSDDEGQREGKVHLDGIDIDKQSPNDTLKFSFKITATSRGTAKFDFGLGARAEIRDLLRPNWQTPICPSISGVRVTVEGSKYDPRLTDFNRVDITVETLHEGEFVIFCTQNVVPTAKSTRVTVQMGHLATTKTINTWKDHPTEVYNTRAVITGPSLANTTNFIDYNNRILSILQEYDPSITFKDWHHDIDFVHHYNTTLVGSEGLMISYQSSTFPFEHLRPRSHISIVFNTRVAFPPAVVVDGIILDFTQGFFNGFVHNFAFLDARNIKTYFSQSIVQQGVGNRCQTTPQCSQEGFGDILGRCAYGGKVCNVCVETVCTPVWRLPLQDQLSMLTEHP